MEIPETKRFIRKGFEVASLTVELTDSVYSQNRELLDLDASSLVSRILPSFCMGIKSRYQVIFINLPVCNGSVIGNYGLIMRLEDCAV